MRLLYAIVVLLLSGVAVWLVGAAIGAAIAIVIDKYWKG